MLREVNENHCVHVSGIDEVGTTASLRGQTSTSPRAHGGAHSLRPRSTHSADLSEEEFDRRRLELIRDKQGRETSGREKQRRLERRQARFDKSQQRWLDEATFRPLFGREPTSQGLEHIEPQLAPRMQKHMAHLFSELERIESLEVPDVALLDRGLLLVNQTAPTHTGSGADDDAKPPTPTTVEGERPHLVDLRAEVMHERLSDAEFEQVLFVLQQKRARAEQQRAFAMEHERAHAVEMDVERRREKENGDEESGAAIAVRDIKGPLAHADTGIGYQSRFQREQLIRIAHMWIARHLDDDCPSPGALPSAHVLPPQPRVGTCAPYEDVIKAQRAMQMMEDYALDLDETGARRFTGHALRDTYPAGGSAGGTTGGTPPHRASPWAPFSRSLTVRWPPLYPLSSRSQLPPQYMRTSAAPCSLAHAAHTRCTSHKSWRESSWPSTSADRARPMMPTRLTTRLSVLVSPR